jgi:prepilin-type N-terminal cleavage/methylation domain-containing protein
MTTHLRPDRDFCAGHAAGFSLLEVLVALGICAVGMVAVLGLYVPVTRSAAAVADAEAAARVADAVRSRLLTVPYASALTLIQEPAAVERKDGDPNYDSSAGAVNWKALFGTLNGEVGICEPTKGGVWRDSRDRVVTDEEKFFEIDLIRNPEMSPAAADALSTHVAFTVRVRWPAFLPSSGGNPISIDTLPIAGSSTAFDHSRKGVLFLAGTISR